MRYRNVSECGGQRTPAMPNDIDVFADDAAGLRRVGTLRRHARREREAASFAYDPDWLRDPAVFSLEPALALGRGTFTPGDERAMFGSIGDSAPDTWGRRLMQRAERRAAEREGRPVRTLLESDYLLGVSDVSRLGALRFRVAGEDQFRASGADGVPTEVDLGRLLQITQRILRDEETDEDLRLIFAPGSSLGGARPKVSAIDRHGRLAIAKFPKETDDYSMERSSYPELVDAVTQFGSQATVDTHELYRRVAFNVLVSNVDDHLRNHGFLWTGRRGWTLSAVFDINPTPADVRARILTTAITPDDATCDVELVLSAAEYFNLAPIPARAIVKEVACATAPWRDVAAALGARPVEIRRMESAFEHDDRRKALAL